MNNDVFPNKFKAALAAKQVQIGCWSALSNPISTEVLGLAHVRHPAPASQTQPNQEL
ncbi:hypothetical protein JAO23_18845, partial [Escherichia coli]|nr:hypothetical protein [Escherichia coli]